MSGYVLSHSRITSDVIDNEAIIVDLEQGIYFSCNSTASYVWAEILKSRATSDVIDDLAKLSDAPARASVEEQVSSLIQRLVSNKLLRVSEGITSASNLTTPELERYETPKLEFFTDMQDLLVLDPIHEVTEQGWPNRSH